jgi:hypothetical protein
MYGLNKSEIAFIEKIVRPMDDFNDEALEETVEDNSDDE